MYDISLATGQTGTRVTVTDRDAVNRTLDQLKHPDAFIAINPGAADLHGTEVYVPVRAITSVTVTKRS
jgi:hypothetical protein